MKDELFAFVAPLTSTTTPSNQPEANTRRKRSWSRAVFSSFQRKGLERRFSLQKYITKPDRRQLAATLGLTDAQVACLTFYFIICFAKKAFNTLL